ncbi:hypothetical protein PUV47_03055 [Pseudovibrio exalbescens]|uniref:hypothetical protein n=1 Tax=Pseudovibrio exalbescens TaxID=197461 RepID=UPI002365C2F2|nr:hypothetical protein [Pseudovibrio exalbescens]MDD7908881.1 hypothetical protein [Pseudovibrio exalbescens]
MLKSSSFYSSATCASVLALSLAATPALASDARSIVDGVMASYKAAGASVASYEGFSEEGDTVTLSNVKMEVPISFTFKDSTFEIHAAFDTATVDLVGAEENADSYIFEEIVIPELGMHMTFNYPDDAEDADLPTSSTSKLLEYRSFNVSIPKEGSYPILTSPSLFENYAKLQAFFLASSADRETIASVETQMELPGGGSQTARLTGMDLLDRRGGKLARYDVASYETTEIFPESAETDRPKKIAITMGQTSARDLSSLPILSFLGLSEQTEGLQEIIGSMSIQDIRTEVETKDETANFNADLVSISKLKYAPGNFSRLLQVIEDNNETDGDFEETAARNVFKHIGSFAFDSFLLQDISFGSEAATANFGEIALRDFSGKGFGSIQLTGLEISSVRDERNMALGHFAIRDVIYPDLVEVMLSAKDVSETPIQAALDKAPQIGAIELGDIKLVQDGKDALSLKGMALYLTDYINKIPTKVSFKTEALNVMPNEFDGDALVPLVGERIKLDQNTDIAWNEDTQELVLNDNIELAEGFNVQLNIELGGVDRMIFETPDEAEAALVNITLNRGSIRITDAKLVTKFIKQSTEQSGMPEDVLVDMLVSEMVKNLGPVANTEFGKELQDKLALFLLNPENLEIELAPEQAVPVMQIAANAMLAPQALPKVLGATIKN